MALGKTIPIKNNGLIDLKGDGYGQRGGNGRGALMADVSAPMATGAFVFGTAGISAIYSWLCSWEVTVPR